MIRPRPRRAMEGETVFAGTSAKPSVGEGFYPSRRFCTMFRAGQSPAPTLSLRGRIAPVAIRVLCLPLRGRWREAPEGLSKGTFRAPARVTFGRSPKSDQKVCLKPQVSRLPARYALFFVVGLYRTVAGISFCRAVKRIVSASAPLPLTSATAEPTAPTFQDKRVFQSRPSAATYLCRFAAKARFDNRPSPGGYFQKGGPQPSLFGRFKVGGFLRGKGNRNPFPLEWRFWLLLSLLTKVTRRRQKSPPSETKEQKKQNGHPFGYPLSLVHQPMLFSFSVSALFLWAALFLCSRPFAAALSIALTATL